MNNGVADVDLSAIDDWKTNLVSCLSGVSSIRDVSVMERETYFEEFERLHGILKQRFEDAEAELREAEEVLRRMEMETDPDDDDRSTSMCFARASLEVQKAVVEKCRRRRDECERKLKLCALYIGNCKVKGFPDKLEEVESKVMDAHGYLNDLRERIVAYNSGFSANLGFAADQRFTAPTSVSTGEPACIHETKKGIQLKFYNEYGLPMPGAQIIIIDNKPMGFNRITVVADQDGKVFVDGIDTKDCSIFINGREVYSGPLGLNDDCNIDNRRVKRIIDKNTRNTYEPGK